MTLWNTLLRLNVSRDDVADDILLVGICRATEIMKQNIFMPINYVSKNMYNLHNNELISMLAITDLSASTDPISATTAV